MMKHFKYRFGDKALSGFVRQKINQEGDIFYKGAFHLFGSKVPIYLYIEPYDKYVKGEKLYKVFTYLTPMPSITKRQSIQVALGSATRSRMKAVNKLEETVKKLGVAYEYQKINEERIQKNICRGCIKSQKSEWEHKLEEQAREERNKRKALAEQWRIRLRKAVKSTTKRQREICERKIQRLLARIQRNQRECL